MQIKMYLFFAILNCQINCSVNPYTSAKQAGDWIIRNTIGYIDISKQYHPQLQKYLEKLHTKYPAEFKDTSAYILLTKGPSSTFQSIYFPIYWAEKLELESQLNKPDGLFTQATEWIALHEAGHVYNNDTANAILSIAIVSIIKRGSKYKKYAENAEHTENLKKIKNYIVHGSIPIKTLFSIYCASKAYWAWREYRADQFATQHCTNPNSISAAYEFLERAAPAGIMPGLRHSFKNFRLKRIAQAYQEKFRHPIPKTYHATDRITA
jgi:hypothetical protein